MPPVAIECVRNIRREALASFWEACHVAKQNVTKPDHIWFLGFIEDLVRAFDSAMETDKNRYGGTSPDVPTADTPAPSARPPRPRSSPAPAAPAPEEEERMRRRRGNSNGLFHRPHRPRRATLLAVPEQEARHRAAGDVADRRPAPPGWGLGDGGAGRLAW